MTHCLLGLLVCFVSFPLSAGTNISGSGVCMLPNSTVIKCCTGYILVGNMCSECNPGYTGENCSLTCIYGYFGLQCNERCFCSPDEYCDPARGCLCTSTSDYCKNPELTTEITIHSTVHQSHMYNILSSLVFTIAVLVIGIFCIRMLYSKIMKRKDLHSVQNVTTTDKSAPCVDIHPDASPQQIVESIDINFHPLSTVSQRVDEEMRKRKQREHKNGFKTVMFKFPKSVHDAASRGRKMQAKLSISPVSANDKELYANYVDLTYTNKSFRPDSPMNKKACGV